MSKRDRKLGKALKARPGYEVGYAKPPVETRFKPGQSGNPNGRPKGAKNRQRDLRGERLKEIIRKEAYRKIPLRDGDRSVMIPMAQAVMRSIAVNAARGQHRAQRLFAELVASVEAADRHVHERWVETMIGYKLHWEAELRRREALGITDLPEPVPHPDQVVVDPRADSVKFVGPWTPEEKAEFDRLLRLRQFLLGRIEEFRTALETEGDPEEVAELEKGIEAVRKALRRLERLLPA